MRNHNSAAAAYPGASVCKLCHWYTFCVEQLAAADDLTLIPYLGRSLRDAMKGTVASVGSNHQYRHKLATRKG